MVGSRLVTEAVSRGHRVTAASRHPAGARSAAVLPVAVDAGAPAAQRDTGRQADVLTTPGSTISSPWKKSSILSGLRRWYEPAEPAL
ncbi:hypothetical protein [Streptomyces sp. NPDC094144]|uniref:hypothetical protein n=1 Tax=Streptomyces sp. NPDC094144 TaxID=3366056 RepID=UPI00380EA047